MTSIHPIFFIIVGAIVSVTSHFATNKEYDYSLFFYAGIIFAVYGLVKWIVVGFRKGSKYSEDDSFVEPSNKKRPLHCAHCKVNMPANYKFCPFCGRRVK